MPGDSLTRAAQAASDGDVALLDAILRDDPMVVGAQDAEGRTLLDLACRAATGNIAIPFDPGTPGQHAAVAAILRAGADPAAADPDGWTPLHTAAMAGHADLARRLVRAGASVAAGAYGRRGGSPLAYALFYGKTHMAASLTPVFPDNLRAGAALGLDLDGYFAAGAPTERALDGLDFYAPTFFPTWNRTYALQEVIDEALSWASRNDQVASVRALLDRGANVNANAFRGTALLWACYADAADAARLLLDAGADPDLRHDFGGAGHGVAAVAMHLAAQANSLKCLRLLLERGADPTIVDGAHGGTPLGWAEFGGATEAAALLKGA